MNVVAIVQARMTSTRLPGKVLADLDGEPMLARVVERARAAASVTSVWVACTDQPEDDPIVAWCDRARVPVFRGSESDVLARFVAAGSAARADVVVRITADCPLMDPAVIDRVVETFTARLPEADYAANVLERSFPRGLDVEVFSRVALDRMDRHGRSLASREHVTVVARLERPEAFIRISVRADRDDSDLRWTVDTAADLEFVRLVYRSMGLAGRIASYEEVVRWCRANESVARRDDHGETWDPSRVAPAASEGSDR